MPVALDPYAHVENALYLPTRLRDEPRYKACPVNIAYRSSRFIIFTFEMGYHLSGRFPSMASST